MTSRPRFDGERVLVTGASGFIGSHLCRVLGQQGAEIHATSRRPRPAPPGSVHWYEADLTDIESSRALLRSVKPDVIFHLAGRVTAAPTLDLVLPTFHSLVGGAVNLLVAATETGCRRFILPGSVNEPAYDAAEPMPSSPYAAAKSAASAYARMFHGVFGAPVVVARLFVTYGPGQQASKLVPYVTRCLLRGGPTGSTSTTLSKVSSRWPACRTWRAIPLISARGALSLSALSFSASRICSGRRSRPCSEAGPNGWASQCGAPMRPPRAPSWVGHRNSPWTRAWPRPWPGTAII